MKINWKLRLQNKATLAALAACIVTFVYQVFGIIGIVAPVTQDMTTQLICAVLNILAAVGVIVDPTTSGARDSDQALEYKKPK